MLIIVGVTLRVFLCFLVFFVFFCARGTVVCAARLDVNYCRCHLARIQPQCTHLCLVCLQFPQKYIHVYVQLFPHYNLFRTIQPTNYGCNYFKHNHPVTLIPARYPFIQLFSCSKSNNWIFDMSFNASWTIEQWCTPKSIHQSRQTDRPIRRHKTEAHRHISDSHIRQRTYGGGSQTGAWWPTHP